MSAQKKDKAPTEAARLDAIENNMKQMMTAIGSLTEAVKTALQPQVQPLNAPMPQKPPETQPSPTAAPKSAPPAPTGQGEVRQVAKQFAPQVAPPPVHHAPQVIGRIESIQSTGPMGGPQMAKAVAMMEKMDELKYLGSQGYACSDAAMFNPRQPRNNPKAKPLGQGE